MNDSSIQSLSMLVQIPESNIDVHSVSFHSQRPSSRLTKCSESLWAQVFQTKSVFCWGKTIQRHYL